MTTATRRMGEEIVDEVAGKENDEAYDEEELLEELEDEGGPEDDGMDNGLEEVDPQVLKIEEKIRLHKHRCSASLGTNLFEKAFGYLQGAKDQGGDEVREKLVDILGEDNIGFWAIMDQIMFLQEILDDLKK